MDKKYIVLCIYVLSICYCCIFVISGTFEKYMDEANSCIGITSSYISLLYGLFLFCIILILLLSYDIVSEFLII